MPGMKAKTVRQYIAAAPKEHRPALRTIRALIREHLPHATEQMGPNGFAIYTAGEEARWLAGFACPKKGPMLYIMNSKLLDEFADELGKLRTGKSCIEWREAESFPIESLKLTATKLLRRLGRRQ